MRRISGVLLTGLALAAPRVASSEVISGKPIGGGADGGREVIAAWLACSKAKPVPADCAARRSLAIEKLVAALHTLGGAGNFAPLPTLLTVAGRSPEPELRVAAVDGIGMIGPSPAETAALARAFDDPVPAVRGAARVALGASGDPAAVALAGRAVRAQEWKSLVPEKAPDLSRLGMPLYAGATALRFASDVAAGTGMAASADPPDKVLAFYAGKAKGRAMSLEEFESAYSGSSDSGEAAEDDSEDDSGDDSGDDEGGMPSAEAMAKAMAMMQQMNQAMSSGKSMEEVAAAMGGARQGADSAASTYADESIYGSPRVVVLEESDFMGQRKPVRYVVVFRDKTLGKTGIALHAPVSLR